MNIFEKFIYLLQGEMTEPKAFGLYHIMWIIILISSVFFLRNKRSEKNLKVVLGTYGIIALTTEILKQIAWSFNYENGIVTWDYQWYAFPFQLCSTPIYVSIICLLLKDGNLRKTLLSYLAYITILGGIATVLMPDSCFVRDILVNIHTMWLHCGSVVIALYLLISGKVELNFKSIINALKVFVIMVVIASILNIIMFNSGVIGDETFNMFFISPYFNSSLPVFSSIQPMLPYPLFLLIYLVIVAIASSLVLLIGKLIKKFVTKYFAL